MKQRRDVLKAIGALGTLGALGTGLRLPQARASAWPDLTKIALPFAPGGAVDGQVRLIGEQIGTQLGTNVIVENKPGAAGIVAAQSVANSAANGSSILFLHSGLPTVQAMTGRLHLLEDFKPVTRVTSSPFLLMVRGDAPYQSFDQLIDAIQRKPGALNYGSGGVGSPIHLMVEFMSEQVPGGLKATHVPYKGGSIEAVFALLGGQIDFTFALPAAVGEYVKAGKLRALATTDPKRFENFPKVPSIVERWPRYEAPSWGGFAVPEKTPDDVVARLDAALKKAMAAPAVAAQVQRFEIRTELSDSPAAFAQQIRREIDLNKTLVARLGLTTG